MVWSRPTFPAIRSKIIWPSQNPCDLLARPTGPNSTVLADGTAEVQALAVEVLCAVEPVVLAEEVAPLLLHLNHPNPAARAAVKWHGPEAPAWL